MLDPIFIHASARTGSTFTYHCLRRDPALMVFNEAIIDGKPRSLGPPTLSGSTGWANQDFLTAPDYIEFLDCPEAMADCPEFPTFTDWTPKLERYLAKLIRAAQAKGRRPVFCEINSRPMAGWLRDKFGGYHLTQIRDPISQFGSFLRALFEGHTWGYLQHPLIELAIYNPGLGTPKLPWDISSRAAHWISDARYTALAASLSSEELFRYHFLSWLVNNNNAIKHSHNWFLNTDPNPTFPIEVDWSGRKYFDRYYSLNFSYGFVVQDCISHVKVNSDLINIAAESVAQYTQSPQYFVSIHEWEAARSRARKLWHNSTIRWLAGKTYPFAAPVGRALRSAGLPL